MDELPRSARDALAQLKGAHEPDDPESKARVRRGVAAAIGVASASAIASPAAASSLGHSGLKSALGWALGHKLGSAVLVLSVVATSAVVVPRFVASPAPRRAASAPPRVEALPGASSPATAPAPSQLPEDVAVQAPPVEPAPRAVQRPRRALATPAPDTLAEEIGLIGRADQALSVSRPEDALGLLGEHAQRYPSSRLTTERQGLVSIAHCMLGSSGGLREAEQFLRTHPKAVLAARVARVCGIER